MNRCSAVLPSRWLKKKSIVGLPKTSWIALVFRILNLIIIYHEENRIMQPLAYCTSYRLFSHPLTPADYFSYCFSWKMLLNQLLLLGWNHETIKWDLCLCPHTCEPGHMAPHECTYMDIFRTYIFLAIYRSQDQQKNSKWLKSLCHSLALDHQNHFKMKKNSNPFLGIIIILSVFQDI